MILSTVPYRGPDTTTRSPDRGAVLHRALVRHILAAEYEFSAVKQAVESLDRLEVLMKIAPLTDTARRAALDWLDQARVTLVQVAGPLGPRG